MPKVSIIIPVYNVKPFLRHSLQSALSQTLPDLEILAINDGSTDGSGEILDELAAQDSRLRVFHQKNQGQSAARNVGLDHARGEYIAFLDSDDWLSPDLCEKAYARAKTSGADITMFFYWREKNGHRSSPYRKFPPVSCDDKFGGIEKLDALLVNYQTVWSSLWRRDFLTTAALRFPLGVIFEDIPFCVWGAWAANRIAILPERLYHYRIGSGYSTDRKQRLSYLQRLKPFHVTLQKMEEDSVSEAYRTKILDWKYNACYTAYVRKIPAEHREAFRQQILADFTDDDWHRIEKGGSAKLKTKKRRFFAALRKGPVRWGLRWEIYSPFLTIFDFFRYFCRYIGR